MSNIPTIPGTAQAQDVGAGAKVDPRYQEQRIAAGAQTLNAGVGAVVSGVSAIADYEQKKQNAEDVAGMNQATISLNLVTSGFRSKLKQMPDKQIVPKWGEVSEDTKQKVMDSVGPNLSPQAKRVLGNHLNLWQSDATTQFQIASDELGSQRRKATAESAAHMALQSGEPEAINNATASIDAAVKAGDWTPQQADFFKAQFPRILSENQVRNGMEANPVATLNDIQSGKFDGKIPPGPLMVLKRQTEKAVSMQQAQGRDELLSRNDAGEPIDESEIATKEAAGQISPTGAKGVRNAIAQTGLKQAKDANLLLMMRADDHDWTGDKTPEKSAQQIKDEGAALPLPLRKALYEHVDMKLRQATKADAAEENPVHKDVLARMKEDRDQNGLTIPMASLVTDESSGFLGLGAHPSSVQYQHVANGLKGLDAMSDDDIKEKFGPDATLTKIKQAEQLHYAQQLSKMRDWLKANPQATDEKAEQYRQTLEKPYVSQAVSSQLLKGHPTAITTQQEFDELPNGAPFIFNGRIGTKQ